MPSKGLRPQTEMGSRVRKVRATIELSERLNKRLVSYGIAAGVTGLGLLGTAPAAEGDIIYTQANTAFGPNSFTSFDLNHDGVADFGIEDFGFFSQSTHGFRSIGSLALSPAPGNAGLFRTSATYHFPFLAPLGAGSPIGPKALWTSFGGLRAGYFGLFCDYRSCTHLERGYWQNSSAFMGLKFLIDGQTHYGWAELETYQSRGTGGYDGTLISFAYETVPNRGLLAGQIQDTPEPATLRLLALGSLVLGLWRKKRIT